MSVRIVVVSFLLLCLTLAEMGSCILLFGLWLAILEACRFRVFVVCVRSAQLLHLVEAIFCPGFCFFGIFVVELPLSYAF